MNRLRGRKNKGGWGGELASEEKKSRVNHRLAGFLRVVHDQA